jgi:uncharacterized SAM-binding protein YcdF (DUF218 family)
MFFIFSKLLLFLIAPISWIILFLIFSIFSKDNVRRKKFLLISVIMFLFFSNTFIFDRFMHAWEMKATPGENLSHYDGAIVLTGMSTYDPSVNRLEFNDRSDRLMQAIRLYKEKKIDKLILCGGASTIGGNDTSELPMLKKYLVTIGILADDIIFENQSRNTHENAVNLKSILETFFPNGKFLLISSGWHLKRATACFLKEGIAVTPYSTDRYSGPVKLDIDYLIIPSSETLFNWEKLIHEWVGTIVYKFNGYL